jgi:nitroreductase
MEKGSEKRRADHPIDKIFLDRWSPRAMSGEAIAAEDLMALFEAARWAPSSFNNQSWRVLYARRDSEHWPLFLGLLVEGNRIWANKAAALLLFISKTTFDYNGKPARTHSFDTGAAWENLALQAMLRGYVAHGMQGFDYDRARTELRVPAEYQVEAMIAVGRPGSKESLPEKLQAVETPNDRRPLTKSVCEGPFRL